MQKAIVVFSKVPKIGDIKTRLTTDRGGILTPEEAKQFYEACVLDVIDCCIASNSGDLYICYNLKGDRDYLEELLASVSDREVIKGVYPDQGGTFDQCMQYAADYILKDEDGGRLADSVIIVGGDLPTLQPATLRDATAKLERLASSDSGKKAARCAQGSAASLGAAIVQGACQEGGFSLVGLTYSTPLNFDGVFYNKDGITALDALVDKASMQNIPFGMVEMIPDVDIPLDLASMITSLNALQLAARFDDEIFLPERTIRVVRELGLEASAAPYPIEGSRER